MGRDVVTIYCCGTNFGRDRAASEAVAHSWELTTSRKLILDGPGSPRSKPTGPGDPRILKAENLMKAIEGGKGRKKGKQKDGRAKIPKSGTKALRDEKFEDYRTYSLEKNWEGSISGVGWADNVIVALNWLWEEFYVGKDSAHESFKTINLVGWSRGAVTCIMLAHAIEEAGFKKKQPDLQVNVFCFDPVPGSKHDFKTKKKAFDSTGRVGSTTSLPEVVTDYRSVLMENETSSLFGCVSPREFSGLSKTITEYPMPGVHSDCVLFMKPDNHAGRICLHLCHEFLKKNGTDLSKWSHILTGTELIEAYSNLRLQMAAKKKYKRVSKARKKLVVNDRRADAYYVNGHHYETFKSEFPQLVTALEKGPDIPERLDGMMRVRLKDTKKALKTVGLMA